MLSIRAKHDCQNTTSYCFLQGTFVDISSSSKDKLQAQTPQQQHDGSKKTQSQVRQMVPVDSKKHLNLQLESVGRLKSRPSEELVNSSESAKRSSTRDEVSWKLQIIKLFYFGKNDCETSFTDYCFSRTE